MKPYTLSTKGRSVGTENVKPFYEMKTTGLFIKELYNHLPDRNTVTQAALKDCVESLKWVSENIVSKRDNIFPVVHTLGAAG